jgi:hypothetical protein
MYTLVDGRPGRRTPPPKYMSNVKGVGQAANVHMSATQYVEQDRIAHKNDRK